MGSKPSPVALTTGNAMREAFLRAIPHRKSKNATVVVPTGEVHAAELARVMKALNQIKSQENADGSK